MKRQPDLSSLIEQWDRKLAKSGFKDIEDRKTGMLKEWSGRSLSSFSEKSPDFEPDECLREGVHTPSELSQAEYYRQASHVLYEAKLKGPSKQVWAMHVEGKSLTAISDKLGIPRSTVQLHIDRVRLAHMGLRTGQFNRKQGGR